MQCGVYSQLSDTTDPLSVVHNAKFAVNIRNASTNQWVKYEELATCDQAFIPSSQHSTTDKSVQLYFISFYNDLV